MTNKLDCRIKDPIEQLYRYFRNRSGHHYLDLHEVFIPLYGVLCQGYNMPTCNFDNTELDRIHYNGKTDDIILFSGGKVSMAIALSHKDAILLHFGEKIEVPGFNIENITRQYDMSNPISIISMVCEAIQWSMDRNLNPIIYLGIFEMTSISNNPLCLWSNCIEIIRSFEKAVQEFMPDFRIELPLPSYAYAWDILMDNREYVKHIRTENEVDEMVLAIAKDDWDIEKSKNYILYIEKLKNILAQENEGVVNKSDNLWQRYFFYNISRSRHTEEIKKFLED